MTATGTAHTRLIVLRGNSGAGKSTTACALRERGGRRLAWVEQDYLRRIVLREHDKPGAANIGLISQTVRYALDHEHDVVLEGILFSAHYSEMLRMLRADHVGRTYDYYFDDSFAETIRRHATRPECREFGADAMRQWYQERDLLDFVQETLIPETWSLAEIVERILTDTHVVAGVTHEDVAHRAAQSARL